MSFFHNAIAGAHKSVRRLAGVEITYQRGSDFVTLAATPGKSEMTATNSQGVTINVTSKDFIVSSCDLVLNGQAITPLSGDVIMQEIDGKFYQYVVRRQDGGSQVYRDAGGGHYRIHCKEK